MFGLNKLIDAAFVFYTEGYLDIPRLQMEQQQLYAEQLRIRKMKERFLYHSSRVPSDMTIEETREFDYLTWYFNVHLKKDDGKA